MVLLVATSSIAADSARIKYGVAPSGAFKDILLQHGDPFMDALIDILVDGGISNVRTGISCHILLTGDDTDMEYLDAFDRFFAKCAAESIGITFLLAYGCDGEGQFIDRYGALDCGELPFIARAYSPVAPDTWEQYIHAVISRYGEYIDGFEVWNEPNAFGEVDGDNDYRGFFWGQVDDYIDLFERAVAAIRALDLETPIATGGLEVRESIFRPYIEKLFDSGVADLCDAFGLHMYDARPLYALQTYHEVCTEKGRSPKPIWVTEFARPLNLPTDKPHTIHGSRAFYPHIIEMFHSYGAQRVHRYNLVDAGPDGQEHYRLFRIENGVPVDNYRQWSYYRDAIARYAPFSLSGSVGYGKDEHGSPILGVVPFEDFTSTASDEPGTPPIATQSAFIYENEDAGIPLKSFEHLTPAASFELPMAFDVNDQWADSFASCPLIVEIEIVSDDGMVELRHQAGEAFRYAKKVPDDSWSQIACERFLDHLAETDSLPDYETGVSSAYASTGAPNGLIVSHPLDLEPGELSVVRVPLTDYVFQNGMAKRADLSLVPVGNAAFEVHRIEIYPGGYIDRSDATTMQYSGQPRNAISLNFNSDQYKDLLISRFDDEALACRGTFIDLTGTPQFEEAPDALPPGSPPLPRTTGFVSGDFDDDGLVDAFVCDFYGGAKLYRNTGGAFVDWTTASGLAAILGGDDDVYGASWADYDGDGDLDLTVLRDGYEDMQGNLFVYRNDGGTFAESVLSATPSVGNSPLWADFDGDADLDLLVLKSGDFVVGPPGDYANYFFINQGDGTFVDEAWERLGDFEAPLGIATVLDVENDGDLDVAVAWSHEITYLENDASGHFTQRSVSVGCPSDLFPTDIAVFDYDLDGFQDLLVAYGQPFLVGGYDTQPSTIFLLGNRAGSGDGRSFVDETASAGLSGSGFLTGFAPADYNQDGFTDLYLGRQSDAPFFYKATGAGSSWLGVRLHSPHGANNTAGLGATVRVTAGDAEYVRVVDGGSGLASQLEADLVFGLGQLQGTATITVTWPSGRCQTLTGVPINQYTTVVDDSPVVDPATVSFQKVFDLASGEVDWIFTWETYNASTDSLDRVIFDYANVPGVCQPSVEILTPGTPGVTAAMTGPVGGRYVHTLTLADVPCEAPCAVPYIVQSALSDHVTRSEQLTASVRYCIQSR